MIRQDIVYALRTMRRKKMATSTAILVLALGIGSTAAIFTLANGILLRPLPFPDQEAVVYVEEGAGTGRGSQSVAFPNFLDLRARSRTLQDFALYSATGVTLRGEMEGEQVQGSLVTASLFQVLGVPPLAGRAFSAEDDYPNSAPVVILSENLWRRRYGADPAIVGKSIVVGTRSTQVVGVMPRGFQFPAVAEIWIPFRGDPRTSARTDHFMEGIARLKPGVPMEQAQGDLRTVMEQIVRENPVTTFGQTVNVTPFRNRTARQLETLLFTVLGAAGFVLLIACANIANLMLVKSTALSREIAVRAAMGASRPRLLRQFLVESLLLGFAGAGAGALFAWAAVFGMMRLVPPNYLPYWVSFAPDTRTLGFLIGITLLTGIVAGAAPVFSAGRVNLVETLKEGGRSATAGGAKAWVRSGLVVAEVAISVLLLVGAGLMIRTFLNLNGRAPGFQVENLTTLSTSTPGDRYPGPQAAQLARRVRQEFSALPGVISVAAASASGVPLLSGWGRSFTAEGHPVLALGDAPMIHHVVATPGYFQTLGIPILEGRDFTEQDTADFKVTILDAGLARRYWPNQSAVGKRVRYGPPADNEPWHVVVGVVGEVRNQGLRAVGQNSVYLPFGERPIVSANYLVRSAGGLADPGSALRARLTAADRTIVVTRVQSMQAIVQRAVWQERFFATILAFFGALALLLAVVGLYGVMAYAVARRTHEMGIRMALGASAGEIRRMILLQSGRLIALGLVLGTAGAWGLTRYLAAQLYDVSPTDPSTFVGVVAVLAAAGLAAYYQPARRATRVDPMLALRAD